MILAIDTSAGQCAVALLDGDDVWRDRAEMTRGHAEALFPMIESVMARAGAEIVDLTRIAVCTGPGSFTGLRVGIAAARGLALGRGIDAVGVTRFEALSDGQSTVAIPGRGDQIYVQAYRDGHPDGDPRLETGVAEDQLVDVERIARIAAGRVPGARPAPLYLRGADAAMPSEPPPRILG